MNSLRLEKRKFFLVKIIKNGKRTQDTTHLLQGQALQEAHAAQSDPVQDGQSVIVRPGQAQIRPKAKGLRWSDQARLQEEGEDHKEDHTQNGVLRMQGQETDRPQEMQTLRVGW
jgi:hypothetical protein